MSYIQFRQRCDECKEEWNAAFGIVGMTQIAAPPAKCPHCGSDKLSKVSDTWLDGACMQHGPYKGEGCAKCEDAKMYADDEKLMQEIALRHSQEFRHHLHPDIKLRMLSVDQAVGAMREYVDAVKRRVEADAIQELIEENGG